LITQNTAEYVSLASAGFLYLTKLKQLSLASIKAAITDAFLRATSSSNDQSADFLAHVAYARGKQKPEELARAVVEEVVATAPIWSATITSVVDYYLDDSRKEETLRLVASNDEQILIYIKRALSTSQTTLSVHNLNDIQGQTLPSLPSVVVHASKRASMVRSSKRAPKS
jgi:FMN-dependent NADH-azoreductase